MSETLVTLERLSEFAADFVRAHPSATIVGLEGELGAGKTTFVRAVIGALSEGRTVRVPSPTFTLHQSFPGLKRGVEHFDLYRLEGAGPPQLMEIGYFDALQAVRKSQGILFVEWPSQVVNLASLELDILLRFEIVNESQRRVRSKATD